MLSAQDLRLTFNPGTPIETKALRGLSLEIPTGQFVTVIGSNGAGKSTFLNSVSGDQSVDSGTIKIDGLDVTKMPVWARSERVARVFQDPMAGTCEDLTIEENMALAHERGNFRGLSKAVKASNRELYRERLATLGLDMAAVLSQLGQQNAVESAGAVQSPLDIVQVRVGGAFNSVEQLKAMPIRASTGVQMRLSDIAEQLLLSPKTVSVYRARVLEKLQLANNAELTVYAIRNNLV